MRQNMIAARGELRLLLDSNETTSSLYIRIHGKNLILGREVTIGPEALDDERDDRVRLTFLAKATYGLSVKRHTGRWDRTPFSGSLDEMVHVLTSFMQHLVAPY